MTEEITLAADAIRNGKIILYPTDTVWALGCDVRNQETISKINSLKKREPVQPFVVMIAEIGQLYDYVQKIPEIAWDIVEFAEKPLTVIYPKGKNVASGMLAADGSIAVQLTKDEFCRKLIQKCGKAITYTSASRHKQAKPVHLSDVDTEIVKGADYVVNSPPTSKTNRQPKLSTMIRLELNGQITFIRK